MIEATGTNTGGFDEEREVEGDYGPGPLKAGHAVARHRLPQIQKRHVSRTCSNFRTNCILAAEMEGGN